MSDESRRRGGDETWFRLLDWTKGQKVSERLAALVLQNEGYTSVDPSHPLGGPDGGKDMVCYKDGLKMIGACYFPRGQQTFKDIKDKFEADLAGVEKNGAAGMAFVTNQEIPLGERKGLEDIDRSKVIDLYHLERLASVLNTPKNYGARLECLDMDITKSEYLAFIAQRDEEHYRRIQGVNDTLGVLLNKIEQQTKDLIGYTTGGESYAVLDPAVQAGTQTVTFFLRNECEYPVFDIRIQYMDLDRPINFDKGIYPAWNTIATYNNLFPKTAHIPRFAVDMSQKEVVRSAFHIQTRTAAVNEMIVAFNVAGRVILAYRIQAGNKVVKCSIPKTIPGYNSEHPESVFNHKPPRA